ncbi:MAG: carboxypeptidase-like regulatory domain-containing protein [Acidobacteriota bacterium]
MRPWRLAAIFLMAVSVWAQPGGPGARPGQRGRGAMGQSRTQADALQGTASVEGTVTHRRTGEPVARAMVYLQKSDGSQGLSLAAGADGKFVFENVAGGNYRVSADRRGFLRGEYGARKYGQRGGLIALTDGQEMKGADVKLDPQSVIAGRILDENGEPMEHVQVMALPRVLGGNLGQIGRSGNAQTDDRGEFRIAALAPGKYYVQAMASRRGTMMQGRNMRRVDEGETETYALTYFPGTTEASAAQPLELGVGQEFLGLSLQVQKARVYKVSGRVQGVEAGNLRVMASPKGRFGFGGGNMSVGVRADGGFELTGLAPGSYTIMAARGGPGGGGAAKAVVEVGNADVEGVNLVFGATMTVQGTIKIEGTTSVSKSNLNVRLVESEGAMSPMGRAKEDGTFTIENVMPDQYRFTTVFLPQGLYLKSVRMSGQDVTGKVIDLTSGATGRFEVLLGSKPAAVSGMVGKATPESLPGTVILVAEGGFPLQMGLGPMPGNQWEASVDQYGAFSIANVPPGDYRVYAFEEFNRSEGYDPEFLKKFESSSEKVKLGEGDVKTIALKQIASDAGQP